jgi:hypothetical protein
MFYFGFSGGINYSNVNFKEFKVDNLQSGQISIEIESFYFSDPREANSALLYGLSYEMKKHNILDLSNQRIKLQSTYITVPLKYQYKLIEIDGSIPIHILLGGFYSLKLNEISSSNDIEYFPQSNYGVITGLNVLHFINSINAYVFLEYNFQYGFASLNNTISTTNNVSHLINIGFKFPSTVF